MNQHHIHNLLSPEELISNLPINAHQERFVAQSREVIKHVLDGKDSRFLLIIGPCSIHDIASTKEYARKLSQLVQSMKNAFQIVMRVYFEKPRTSLGWKGFLYDPWLNGTCDIQSGLIHARQLLIDLADMEIPAGTEFLDPFTAHYFGDLISWGCIGARTSSSPIHRQLASALPMPVAFKNSTEGSVSNAIHGIISAASQHSHMSFNHHGVTVVQTNGNPDCHIVLRGGERSPNYDPQSISKTLALLKNANLPQRVLVDCAHDNSFKEHEKQQIVFESVLQQVVRGNESIRGALLESHLYPGKQSFPLDPSQLQYGVSLTDGCLGWEQTERLIKWAYELLKGHSEESQQEEIAAYETSAMQ